MPSRTELIPSKITSQAHLIPVGKLHYVSITQNPTSIFLLQMMESCADPEEELLSYLRKGRILSELCL